MKDHDAAEHFVTAYNAMPRIQAALALKDDTEIISLCILTEACLSAVRKHAKDRRDNKQVPAVERPMVGAYFPGQF